MSEQERADLWGLAEAVDSLRHAWVSRNCDLCKWWGDDHAPACPVHIARRVLAKLACTRDDPAAIDSEENER